MQANNQNQGKIIKTPNFEWQTYQKKHEICYVKDFLKAHQNQPRSFYETLDLPLPENEITTKRHANLNQVTDVLYKKILMHGQLEPLSKIAKKLGNKKNTKKDNEENAEKDLNYYDQDDSFIDDEEVIQENKHKNQMRLVYAEYTDFNSFEGSLADFVQSNIYKNRLEILLSVAKEHLDDSPKKKLTQQPTFLPAVNNSERKQDLQTLDKVKKKVKKNSPVQVNELTENMEILKDKPQLVRVYPTISLPPQSPQSEQKLNKQQITASTITNPSQPNFEQINHFQIPNNLGFLGGHSNHLNQMIFYPMHLPAAIGLSSIGFPIGPQEHLIQQIHKKPSKIIEIDRQ